MDEAEAPAVAELEQVDGKDVELSCEEAGRLKLGAARQLHHAAVAGVHLASPGETVVVGAYEPRLQRLHRNGDGLALELQTEITST